MDQELKAKYDKLPADVQTAIESSDVLMRLQGIGKKYGLLMDKVGILETKVASVMLGEMPTEEFVDAIEESLGLSTEDAIKLATDVNIEIFLPIRESLMKMGNEETHPIENAPREISEETGSREDILAEIENPTPTSPAISRAPAPGSLALPREITPEARALARDFIKDGLSGEKTATPQKAAIEPSTPQQKPAYSADPYRESIN